MKLENKVAIVTGGARGIGEAIVRKFVEEGAKVVIADVLEKEGNALAVELRRQGHEVFFVYTDVSSTEAVKRVTDYAVDKFGRIDILSNNAGVNIPGSVIELSEEDWDKTMNVNVKSYFLMAKYVLPYMQKVGGGAVVNMASANSEFAEQRLSAYVTSKGAIKMLTKQMAIDFAKDNIRVNGVCPGWVDTTFNDAHAELFGGREEVLKELPAIQKIGRAIQPKEIANIVAFLASDEASCMVGSTVMADGGITAGA